MRAPSRLNVMGLFDEVHCEAALPAGHPENARDFQTKSLDSCMDSYTITRSGRLILHLRKYEPDEDVTSMLFPNMKLVSQKDIDTEYHGDIVLVSTLRDWNIDYVARFTHGNLEWIHVCDRLAIQDRGMFGD